MLHVHFHISYRVSTKYGSTVSQSLLLSERRTPTHKNNYVKCDDTVDTGNQPTISLAHHLE